MNISARPDDGCGTTLSAIDVSDPGPFTNRTLGSRCSRVSGAKRRSTTAPKATMARTGR